MDIEYVNFGLALVALISSFFAHLRHSRCCYGLVDIDMKKQNTPPSTPINNDSKLNRESDALLQPSICIPIPEKPKIKNWL